MITNPPAKQEPPEKWVRSLGGEEPLEEDMATHFSTLVWKIPRTEQPCWLWGHKELDTTEVT